MRILSVFALLALCGVSTPSRAAESYDNCIGTITTLPVIISTQGVWCLKSDLATSITSGEAIAVAVNNVTIDCNGFKLGGLAAGMGTGTVGILSSERVNTTVRGCNIRGFAYGIVFSDGGGHVAEGNRFDANTIVGVYTSGDGVIVRDNEFLDTGGSAVFSAAYGVFIEGFTHVLDNTVFGVVATGTGEATGIRATTPGVIQRNRVSAVMGATGQINGISVTGNYGLVDDNYIYGHLGETFTGIRCANGSTTARDNVIAETVTGVVNCMSVDNVVQL